MAREVGLPTKRLTLALYPDVARILDELVGETGQTKVDLVTQLILAEDRRRRAEKR